MSDRDHIGNAWKISPTEYLSRRPPTHGIPEPSSYYVTMPDGCRLAVDVYLPEDRSHGRTDTGRRFPVIAVFTPYYRRFKTTGPGADRAPGMAIFRDFFVPRGYAMVAVDVRGCGASFGTRDSFRSPREREDYRSIADWIVAQPWSNGVIGSTGISYVGAAACFLASTGHPAVKAIAPLFAVSDTYSDHVFPGGIMCTTVTANYDHMVRALDQDLREELKPYVYFNAPNYAGPQPVDDDPDGTLLRMAIEEHSGSFRLRDMAGELAFREEPTPHDPDLHLGACSPYWYLSEVAGKVAIYSISGWYDGSAFANASISRWLTNRGANDRLLLGPWDHGARSNGSPWRGDSPTPQFPLLGEVLRFFDEHLSGLDTEISAEAPIHYHTVREEKWQAAAQWPPHEAATRYFLSPSGQLSPRAPQAETQVAYQTQFTTGTGKTSRFERLMSIAVTDYYSDWNERHAQMLSFTSAPFDSHAELTGHAVVRLHVSTSERDGSVFVYLSEVDAEGRSWYITEGALRMLHRATSACPPTYRTTWPFRTFHRADAQRMTPGKAETLHFALLPVSWRFAPGSRLRLSIAGTDADHFAQVPHGRPPRFEFTLGGKNGSYIELPFLSPDNGH
jgi:putative CocE/NonD family hydrolase